MAFENAIDEIYISYKCVFLRLPRPSASGLILVKEKTCARRMASKNANKPHALPPRVICCRTMRLLPDHAPAAGPCACCRTMRLLPDHAPAADHGPAAPQVPAGPASRARRRQSPLPVPKKQKRPRNEALAKIAKK